MVNFETQKEGENNPLLEPIHGITLQDFAAVTFFFSSGMDMDTMLKSLGTERAIWEEANILWVKRMQEDTTFTLAGLFSQYMQKANEHPKLSTAQSNTSNKGAETLKRMKEDRYFFMDVQAELNASYEYGMDGAQQLWDKYGINIGDMAPITSYYVELDGNNYAETCKYGEYLANKMKEYANQYASEQGGNIADDIEF